MRENTSPEATSSTHTLRPTGLPTDGSYGRTDAADAHRHHRAWHGVALMMATVATAGVLAVGVTPAAAAPVGMTTTSSPSVFLGSSIRATINIQGASVAPTGTATFSLYGPYDANCTSAPVATTVVAMQGTSAVTPPYVPARAGVYRWVGAYSGDANYSPAGPTACSSAAADVDVNRARTSAAVAARDPYFGWVFADATVTGQSPTGTLTFSLFAPSDSFCTHAPVFTSQVSVSGAGTYPSAGYSPSTAGTYRWKAYYGGDSDNLGATTGSCNGMDSQVAFTA